MGFPFLFEDTLSPNLFMPKTSIMSLPLFVVLNKLSFFESTNIELSTCENKLVSRRKKYINKLNFKNFIG